MKTPFTIFLAVILTFTVLNSRTAEAQEVRDSLQVITLADSLSTKAIADSIAFEARMTADNIIEEAMKYLGTPYRTAGKGPEGFDCSGFTGYIYRQFGYHLSASSRTQCNDGREVPPPFDNLQKGDILIFGARGATTEVGHVGIYIGPDAEGDGFTFIHSAVHGGIIISNIKEEYYSRRYLGARRLLPDFTVPDESSDPGLPE